MHSMHEKSNVFTTRKWKTFSCMIFFCLFIVFIVIQSSLDNTALSLIPNKKLKHSLSTQSKQHDLETDTVKKENVLLVQFESSTVSLDVVNTLPTSYNDARKYNSLGNSGNYVWQTGGIALIKNTNVTHCVGSLGHCTRDDVGAVSKYDRIVRYRPGANMFVDMIQTTFRIAGHVSFLTAIVNNLTREEDYPLFLVGVGVQFEFNRDIELTDLCMAKSIALKQADFSISAIALEMFKIFESRKQVTFFRGEFINSIAKSYGYNHGVATGCPSLFINPSVRIGRDVLQAKYDAISSRLGDRSLKLAINVSPKRLQLSEFYVGILERYPNSLIFAQGINDFDILIKRGIPFDRVRFYPNNVPLWIDELKKMDASIGSRIHGNMAALAAGIPIFVISPDYRVKELIETMHVPGTDVYDRILLQNDIDVASLFRDVRFDGHDFDMNRCRIAKMYSKGFGDVGVGLAPHVIEIASIC